MLNVGLFTNEVLSLDLGKNHAGLNHVVTGFEFIAIGTVAFFQTPSPGRSPRTSCNQTVDHSCFPNHVPQRHRGFDGQVQLPTEFTHIGNPRGQNPKIPNFN